MIQISWSTALLSSRTEGANAPINIYFHSSPRNAQPRPVTSIDAIIFRHHQYTVNTPIIVPYILLLLTHPQRTHADNYLKTLEI